jgi:hypothetical protein
MKNKALILTVGLLIILLVSVFASFEILNARQSAPEFFVGVEMAYANATFGDVKDLVDKVKDYTNLFVIGSPEISLNQTLLNITCDYVFDAGLNFIVLFTDTQQYALGSAPKDWIPKATQKYGDKFLAVYRYDEVGGRVLDRVNDSLINQMVVYDTMNYTVASESYVELVYGHLAYYLYVSPSVLTADYGLYWFDYKGGYNSVLAEFIGNQSRELNIAQCRGAASAHDKTWGSIIGWKYDNAWPYIESADELYEDLTLSYRAGAKYAVVFDYPKVERYGILTEDHFTALKNFWNYAQNNPQDYGVDGSEVAYVVPSDYGFGFRNAVDHVWLFDADELSAKVWNDTNALLSKYGSKLDIVYDDLETFAAIQNRYSQLFFWNYTINP